MSKMKNKMPLLMILLAATVLAAIFSPPTEQVQVVAPSVRQESKLLIPIQSSAMALEETVLRLHPRNGEAARTSLFEVTSAPVVVVSPPLVQESQPVLPSLPFRVLGTYREGGTITVFLDDNGQGTVVKVGDTLHNEKYRIDAITDEEIQMTYLPLQKKQALALGDMP